MTVDDNINDSPPSGDSQQDANILDDGQDDGQGTDIAERDKGRGVQARIDELTGKIYKLESELADAKNAPPPPPPPTEPLKPDVQQAVEYLKGLGFTRTEDVKQQVQAIEDRMALKNEHSRLENEYDGGDGRPKYDRAKTESFMREHAVYDPEVAYKALHEAELLDWAVKKAGGGTKQRPFIERGGTSGRQAQEDNTITRDKIDEWMKTPEGRVKYEQNRDKILDLMTKGQL
jgi:hypothetical protein